MADTDSYFPAAQVVIPGSLKNPGSSQPGPSDFDYSFVTTPARIAVYDDFLSEPRLFTVEPAPTTDFIGALAATIYQQAQALGGTISYSIILQVTENFIHARFSEMVVSIYNGGKTIRFADQGPGFKNKERALEPGFSSATQPMKRYIKGVGSGLPTVKEWLQVANTGGKITIEDNLNGGAVVTISIADEKQPTAPTATRKPGLYIPSLTEKERVYITLFSKEKALGITDIARLTGYPKATVHADLKRLQEAGIIQDEPGTKRRMLTVMGEQVAESLLRNEL